MQYCPIWAEIIDALYDVYFTLGSDSKQWAFYFENAEVSEPTPLGQLAPFVQTAGQVLRHEIYLWSPETERITLTRNLPACDVDQNYETQSQNQSSRKNKTKRRHTQWRRLSTGYMSAAELNLYLDHVGREPFRSRLEG